MPVMEKTFKTLAEANAIGEYWWYKLKLNEEEFKEPVLPKQEPEATGQDNFQNIIYNIPTIYEGEIPDVDGHFSGWQFMNVDEATDDIIDSGAGDYAILVQLNNGNWTVFYISTGAMHSPDRGQGQISRYVI